MLPGPDGLVVPLKALRREIPGLIPIRYFVLDSEKYLTPVVENARTFASSEKKFV